MSLVEFFRKAGYLTSLFLTFSMPLFVKLLPEIIGIWVAVLICLIFFEKNHRFSFHFQLLLLFIFYGGYLAGVCWSSDKEEAMFELEVKFSLFLFPVIFAVFGRILKEWFNEILLAFITGCVISSLICLSVAFWDSLSFSSGGLVFNTIDPEFSKWEFGGSHFRYINLSIFLHPVYFSLYLLFALTVSIVFLKQKTFRKKAINYSLISVIPLFLLMIYLLSSKAVIVCAIVLAAGFGFYEFISAVHRSRKILIISGLILFIFIALQNPRFSIITKVITNPERVKGNKGDDSFISRIHIWKAGAEIIRQNLVFGVGTGDTGDELVKKYQLYQYKDPLKIRANAHNQYIETFIGLGLIGFLILTVTLLGSFLHALKNRNVLMMIFLFIIAFNFLFESMLNTQAGVVFFGFVFCLLSTTDKKVLKIQRDFKETLPVH